MNEKELTTLLERAGDGLSPDVDAIVGVGAARGRRSLRRRRLASGFGVVAAVGMIAAGISLWPSTDAPTVVDDPGFATAPPAGDRELADPDVIKERLVDALPDGEATNVRTQDHRDDKQGPNIDVRFKLDDARVRASVHIPEAAEDVAAPGPEPDSCATYQEVIDGAADPVTALSRLRPGPDVFSDLDALMEDPDYAAWDSCYRWLVQTDRYECAQDAACWEKSQTHPCIIERECTEQADGSWLRSYSQANYAGYPDRAAETIHVGVQYVTPEGWTIDISTEEPNTEMSATAGPKVITEEDLIALAESDIWFE